MKPVARRPDAPEGYVAANLMGASKAAAVEPGGTLSGEHGVGITKAPYVDMEIAPPAAELMSRIKKAFDPNNILNPGKMFPRRP